MARVNLWLRLAAPVALLAATGCAQKFDARVSRFQAMPAPAGQSFTIRASDAKLAGGLEFSQYAGQVSQKLVALGYQPAADAAAASLVVTMDYGVDQGREKIRTTPGYGRGGCYNAFDPWCGGFGYYRSPYVWGFRDPFLFGGLRDEVESYTVYTSDLELAIARAGSGERVFEGKAKAVSVNDNLTYLVPNLISAMFTGFPGNSGETIRITIAPPAKK